jgi:nitrogen fixation NifU-like protein
MSLDDFVSNMQAEIDAEALADYGPEAFARWKNPLYMGALPDADGHGRVTGTCGDTLEVFLRLDTGRVAASSFLTDGCGPSVVCGSFAAELSLGQAVEDLVDFGGETILARIGGLPEDDRHCAFLAAAAVRAAVDDVMGRQVKKS